MPPLPLLRGAGLALLAGLGAGRTAGGQNHPSQDLVTVEVATVGVGLTTGTPVVILHDPRSDKTLPVWVGRAEAEAIARSLFGVTMPRPMTHDLLSEVIRALDASVEEVRVTELRDDTYYGSVRLRAKREQRTIEVDSRPSDAVALALRTGAPIRVARRLLDEAPKVELAPSDSTPGIARMLGLTVVAPTPEVRRVFGLPEREGVVILMAGGDGAAAGLKRGDLILEVNGRAPKTPAAFLDAVRAAPRNQPVTLKYWRDGGEHEAHVRRGQTAGPGVPA